MRSHNATTRRQGRRGERRRVIREATSTYADQSEWSAHAKESPASNVLENDISFYCSSRLLDPSVRGKARVTPKRRRRDPREKIGRQNTFPSKSLHNLVEFLDITVSHRFSGSRNAFCLGSGLGARRIQRARSRLTSRTVVSASIFVCRSSKMRWSIILVAGGDFEVRMGSRRLFAVERVEGCGGSVYRVRPK